MARIRYLKPDFFFDEDLSELSFEVRIGFQGLWCHADKAGRLEDSPKKLKALIFPYDKIDMIKILDTLTKKPFILKYSVNGKNYIQIINWEKHQKPHHTEKDSNMPEYKYNSNYDINKIKEKEKDKGNGKDKPTQSELGVKQRINNGVITVINNIFEYFCLKTNRKLTLSLERKKILQDRIKEGAVLENMKKAVDNFVNDDWPDRHKYYDIVYCFGVRNKINNYEKWRDKTISTEKGKMDAYRRKMGLEVK